MAEKADPIGVWTRISEKDGSPSTFFVQQWNSQLNVNGYAFNAINAGAGLVGGGVLSDGEVTISMPDVGTAATYGSATEVPVITTDAQGRVTSVTTATPTASVAVEDGGSAVGDFTIFNFVSGATIADAGGGQVNITVTGGGGGSATYVSGVNFEEPVNASGSSFACKGYTFTPEYDTDVRYVRALIDSNAGSDTYVGTILEMSNATSGATVVTQMGQTASNTTGTTVPTVLTMKFATDITLTAGTTYFIGVSITGGVGTNPCRVGSQSITGNNSYAINIPGDIEIGSIDYNTIYPAVSAAFTGTNTGFQRQVWIDGFVTFT